MRLVDPLGLGLVTYVTLALTLTVVGMLVAAVVIRAWRRRADARRVEAERVARPVLMQALAEEGEDSAPSAIEPYVGPYLEALAAGLASKLRGADRAALVTLLERRGTLVRTRSRTRSVSPIRRLRAIEMLGGLGAVSAVDDLVARLDDPDGEVGRSAVRALGRAGSPDSVPALLALLDDDASGMPVHYITLALLRVGPAGAPQLESALLTHGPRGREAAANVLGWLSETASLAALRAALGDPEPTVRAAAVEALGRIGMPDAVEKMIELLDDAQPEHVREMTVIALGRLGEPQAVPALAGALGGSHRMNRLAAEALNRLGHRGRDVLASNAHLAEVRELLPADSGEAKLEMSQP